jgi:hypothetical protein
MSAKIGVVVVHGVADAEQGHNLKVLVDTLKKRAKGRLEPKPYLEVHEFKEKSLSSGEESKPPLPFFLRRATLDGDRDVTFAEVYWADTTRVTMGKATALWAAFRIVFEAHYFIDALVRRNVRWSADWWFAWLLHIATILIRGPIAGANVVLLTVAAVYLGGLAILKLAESTQLRAKIASLHFLSVEIVALGVCVCLLLYFSRSLWKSRENVDLASMEVSAGAMLASAVGIVVVACTIMSGVATDATGYSSRLFWPLIAVWLAVCGCVVAVSVLAVTMILFGWHSGAHRSLWLALALVILQASLWVLFISIPGVLLVGWAKVAGITIGDIELVKYGFGLNFVGIFAIVVTAVIVERCRMRTARNAYYPGWENSKGTAERRAILDKAAKKMPRLLISGFLVTVIIIMGLFSMILNLSRIDYAQYIERSLVLSIVVAVIIAAVAAALYWVLDTSAFVNVIHIARDLIDHHFYPRITFVRWLLPKERIDGPPHPRRTRLLLRLKSAVSHLENAEGCNTIVFVAHSQGTIIVFEYFRELSEGASGAPIGQAQRAVVTFGSPLEHLYAHYFHDYANLGAMLRAQEPYVDSWINLHRIDDQIGNRIDAPSITNVPMEKGGHINYWAEADVADEILKAIDQLQTERESSASS